MAQKKRHESTNFHKKSYFTELKNLLAMYKPPPPLHWYKMAQWKDTLRKAFHESTVKRFWSCSTAERCGCDKLAFNAVADWAYSQEVYPTTQEPDAAAGTSEYWRHSMSHTVFRFCGGGKKIQTVFRNLRTRCFEICKTALKRHNHNGRPTF